MAANRQTFAFLGWVVWLWVCAQSVRPSYAGALDGKSTAPQCTDLQVTADEAICTPERCQLTGDAKLVCDGLTLSADTLTLALRERQQFDGATAQGNVIFTEGNRVVRCQAMTLGADKLQAAINEAIFTIRRPGALPTTDAAGVPLGPWAMTVQGTLRRQASGHLWAQDAALTLCDCGPKAPPSWRLDAPRVSVVPGGRATVYWPRLRVNFLGLGLVPVTPPLLPISWPLTDRAWGFLPPQISFLGPPIPTVDVPLFIPLGESWDVTITPGVRGDWAFAPRLGVRVRGRPSASLQANGDVRLTYDYSAHMAQQVYARTLKNSPSLLDTPAFKALYLQQQALKLRAALNLHVHWDIWQPQSFILTNNPTGALRALAWQTDVTWLSDDAVNRDLGVAFGDRVATYMASRTQGLYRAPGHVGVVGAELMLGLNSTATLATGQRYPVWSNLGPAEARTLHRLPYVALHWPGSPLGRHLVFDGQIRAERYSPWQPHTSEMPHAPWATGQQGLHGTAGVTAAGLWGPVRTHLRVGVDAVGFAAVGPTKSHVLDGAIVTDGQAHLTLLRRYLWGSHTLRPTLRMRSLGHPLGYRPQPLAPDEALFDPALQRDTVTQAWLGVSQTLRSRGLAPGLWVLDVGQPVDLQHGLWLQPSGSLRYTLGTQFEAYGAATVAWHDAQARLPEIRGALRYQSRLFGLWSHYLRASPHADRFVQPTYALAAPRRAHWATAGSTWAHLLRLGGNVSTPFGLDVRYGMTFTLPQPGVQEVRGILATATAQNVEISYHSLCQCWGITAIITASPQAFWQTWRMQAVLNVGDVRLAG